jgi:hypothetical protein
MDYPEHPTAEIVAWARSLKFFRFCAGFASGHYEEGERLLVAIKVDSEPDLVEVLNRLGLPVERIFPDTPLLDTSVGYTIQEAAKYPVPIPEFPGVGQPRHVRIAGAKAFAWVAVGRLQLDVMDEEQWYRVTDASVRAAQRVEPLLAPLAHRLIQPPLNDPRCICPEFYPHYWGLGPAPADEAAGAAEDG